MTNKFLVFCVLLRAKIVQRILVRVSSKQKNIKSLTPENV